MQPPGRDGEAQEADHQRGREVYDDLDRVVGRHISLFLNDLARPQVVENAPEEGYRAMSADEEHERAAEWIEGVVGDFAGERG